MHEQVSTSPQLAEHTIELLADMIRTTLFMSEQETVLLSEELKLVTNYLEIQKLRYEQQLVYKLNISPELNAIRIPPFIIQPIVENSIKHAVDQQLEPVCIEINVSQNNQLVFIDVNDDGPGLTLQNRSGLGLATQNIKDRLSIVYAGDANFFIKNRKPKGVQTRVELPIVYGKTQ